LTSQVLTETPSDAALASMCDFKPSDSRSVTRAPQALRTRQVLGPRAG
jgi:hypothetical protein